VEALVQLEQTNICEDDFPCTNCSDKDHCDGWEARFCCTLCRYDNADPDCDDCDPWDI